MTMANIKLDGCSSIHRDMVELITTLAIDMPCWEFRANHTMQYMCDDETDPLYNTQCAYGFEVWQRDDMVGSIHLDRWNAKPTYIIHNKRIQRTKERGYGMNTKNVDKAIKLAKKWFSTANIADRITDAKMNAQSKLDELGREARYRVTDIWSGSVERQAYAYLAKHWQEFTNFIVENKSVVVNAEWSTFPERVERKHQADRAQYYYHHNQAYMVMIEGDNYVFVRNDINVAPEIKSGSDVPAYYRQHIGMLKLMDFKKDGVPPVTLHGTRVGENAFIIIDEGSDLSWQR